MQFSRANCPFCLEAPAAEIFRTSSWRGIYNRSPVLAGHSLLVPLRHVEHLVDLSEEEAATLVPTLTRLAAALTATYGGSGFDVALQEGVAAGQSIPHLHVHCLPRKEDDLDSPGSWTRALGIGGQLEDSERATLTLQEMRDQAALIRSKASGDQEALIH